MTGPLFPKQIIIKVDMSIKTEEPLSIGAGKAEVMPGIADIPVIKDPKSNNPVIPGSTLKGMFRGYLYRILSSQFEKDKVERFINEIFGSTTDHASLIYFTDAFPENNNVETYVRTHIKINPITGGVQKRVGPFTREYVPKDTTFNSSIMIINTPPSILYLMHVISELSSLGLVKIGGAKSRGYGKVTLSINNAELTIFKPIINNQLKLNLPICNIDITLSSSKTIKIIEKYNHVERSYEFQSEELKITPMYTIIKIANIKQSIEKYRNIIKDSLIDYMNILGGQEYGQES